MAIIIPKNLIDFNCKRCGSEDFKISRSVDRLDRPIIKVNCSGCNAFLSMISEDTANAICELYNTSFE